jgi:hypothetical protein
MHYLSHQPSRPTGASAGKPAIRQARGGLLKLDFRGCSSMVEQQPSNLCVTISALGICDFPPLSYVL